MTSAKHPYPDSLAPASGVVRGMQALVLICVIVPHWLMTRDQFDGATIALAAVLRNPDGLYFWLANSNWLLALYFFKLDFALSALTGIDYLVLAKLALTGLLLALYCEFVWIARKLFSLEADEARLVALLCLASPSLYIFSNSGAVPLLVCIWLVMAGHRLFWNERVYLRVAGLATLAVAFQLNSNLVFALALDVVYLSRYPQIFRQRIKWFVLLFAVAVSVYATMRLLAPPRQLFIEYNQLLNPLRPDDLRRMVRATAMFLTWCTIPLAVVLIACAAAFATRARRQDPRFGVNSLAQGPAVGWFSLAAAAFLCASAAFPYVMVGKGPPLFVPVGFGSGLTEQALSAAHHGLLAPTWANTSGRHGLLYAAPIAILSWLLARAAVRKVQGADVRLPVAWLFAAVLPVFMFWVLPAYKNKLEMQYAEASLVKGLATLPPAPAGIVELRYSPVSDWLVWTNAGTKILREAWGSAAYYALFYAIDVYRDDLRWQYHTYFKNPGGMKSPLIQRSVGMEGFPGEDCQTKYEAVLPQPDLMDLLTSGLLPGRVAAAQVRQVESKCQSGQQLPNPTPEKKAIL